jgi:hypothetical protein
MHMSGAFFCGGRPKVSFQCGTFFDAITAPGRVVAAAESAPLLVVSALPIPLGYRILGILTWQSIPNVQ